MKYQAGTWIVMTWRIKQCLHGYWPEEDIGPLIRRAQPIYKRLLSEVQGVSDKNPMAGNITSSYVIIAIWLASERRITPEAMSEIMNRVLDHPLVRKAMGRKDLNTEKGLTRFADKMHRCADWATAHPEDDNTWVFHFDDTLHKDGFYYYFSHCPIAAFCQEHGYSEITPILCNIDYVTCGLCHGVLHREQTLATGGDKCDYWIVGDRVQNPQ